MVLNVSVFVIVVSKEPAEYTKTFHLNHSLEDVRLWYIPPRGINLQVRKIDEAPNETIVKFCVNGLYPNPVERKYKEDVDKELEKFKIITDRIRSNRDFNKQSHPQQRGGSSTIIDAVLEDLEGTRLDYTIDKAIDKQKMENGKTLGRIWGKSQYK